MAFGRGSLIIIDYTARVKDGEVFDTTRADVAEEHGMRDPPSSYVPRLVSIGEPNFPVLRGLDEALAGADAGGSLTAEVEPAKGFGERDPGKVRMIPLRKLGDDADKVSVGDQIEIDGRRGTVRFMGSGRVQVDYNHRYAGKTLVYDVEVKRSLDSDDDRVSAILERRLGAGAARFSRSGGGIDVEIPSSMARSEGLQGTKHLAKTDMFKFVPSLERVRFVETHANPAAPRPAPAAQGARAGGAAPEAAPPGGAA